MEKAKDKYSDKTITFLSGKMTGRLQADAMDTYNWLKVRDKKIALEFLKKMNFVDKYFEKKEVAAQDGKQEIKREPEPRQDQKRDNS